MMKKINPYILCLILMTVFSCQKDDNDNIQLNADYSSVPVFTFTANDGLYNIEAGRGDFYMFSSYEIDDMEIYSFVGSFSKLSTCFSACNEALTIKIGDNPDVVTVEPVDINTAVSAGAYIYLDSQGFNNLGEILVAYTNSEGIIFRSDMIEQPLESIFQILSVSDYNINEEGQLTKKVEIAFNCFLRSEETGVTISFNNAVATIAVAYPG